VIYLTTKRKMNRWSGTQKQSVFIRRYMHESDAIRWGEAEVNIYAKQ
jgi:hypothetical protein